jgi:hypothetical protein
MHQGISGQKEMLSQTVHYLGSFHLGFEERDDRRYPVLEDVPDFLCVPLPKSSRPHSVDGGGAVLV